MIKTARQLKDLIRNLSKGKSADAQILMRNYMMERSIEIWAYNLETVLAEKLETVVSRATTNTRMRDFYDMHILSQLHGQSIVPSDFRAALIATARKRGTEKYLTDAPAVFDEVEADSNMEKLWLAYQKKFPYAADLSWHTAMDSVRSLYKIAQK